MVVMVCCARCACRLRGVDASRGRQPLNIPFGYREQSFLGRIRSDAIDHETYRGPGSANSS